MNCYKLKFNSWGNMRNYIQCESAGVWSKVSDFDHEKNSSPPSWVSLASGYLNGANPKQIRDGNYPPPLAKYEHICELIKLDQLSNSLQF